MIQELLFHFLLLYVGIFNFRVEREKELLGLKKDD